MGMIQVKVEELSTLEKDTTRILGVVKWFDPVKGFGFIVADEGGADILLHANVLRNFGQSSVADNSEIEVTVQITNRGAQAVEVHRIDAPETEAPVALADFEGMDLSEISATPLEPARVKWFDKGKGFGFANVFGNSEDIFLHIEVLRRSGLSDLQPGEALALRVIDGKRGRMATEVLAWENAALETD
jgi:CspA family cold shock protein